MDTNPGFDFGSAAFGVVALLGIAISIGLFSQKAHPSFRWLGLLVLVFGIMLGEWVLWWTAYIQVFAGVKSFFYPLMFCIGPLLLGYYAQVFPRPKLGERIWVHFMTPGIILLLLLPYYLNNNGIQVLDWERLQYVKPAMRVAGFLLLFHLVFYLVRIYRHYAPAASTGPDMQRWHQWMLRSYGGIVFSFWAHWGLSQLGWMNLRLDYLIAFFIVIFFFLIGWLGFVQPRILAGIPFHEAILPRKYQKSALSQADAAILAERLHHLFETEKTYLDPELRLDKLAKQLNISRHHISQALNQTYQSGFSDWVTSWRIREAKQLLTQHSRQTLIIKEIAWEAGFNTKAAFNLAFKKWTGMTPTEFREQKAAADSP